MRQIQMLAQFIARVVLGKDSVSYEINEGQTGETAELFIRLRELLTAGNINAAEDALHSNLHDGKHGTDFLHITMWFYGELNKMTDEALEASGFSREEIYEGLRDAIGKSGITLPSVM
jgi:hypothetical protein